MEGGQPALLDYFDGIGGPYVELSISSNWAGHWATDSKYLNDAACDHLTPLAERLPSGWRHGSHTVPYGEHSGLIARLLQHAELTEPTNVPVAALCRQLGGWLNDNPEKKDLLVLGY